MRKSLIMLLLAVPLAAFASPPSMKVTGQVKDLRGNGAVNVIVGAKSTASATAANVLADPEASVASDSSGFYSMYAVAGYTHNMAAVQVTSDAGHITRISLPQPSRAAVVTYGQDDVQALRVGKPAPVLNAAIAAQSPVSVAGAAQDNDLATAWRTDPAQPLDQQYVALDLGASTWLAEAVICWQGAAPGGYRVQASDDPLAMSGGGTWRDVYVTAAAKNVVLPGAAGTNVSVVVPAGPTASRYLRVKVDAYSAGHTTAAIADIYVVPTPLITGSVTDPYGAPVAGAAVGGFLDDGPFVFSDAEGRYSLPAPMGTAVVGAHTGSTFVSGPRWLDNDAAPLIADFTLFPQGANVLGGNTPAFSPDGVSGNDATLTDGSLASLWASGRAEVISAESPTRITFALDNATIS